MVITDTFKKRTSGRWESLRYEKNNIDLCIARLAKDIRIAFPKDASGDAQFRVFVKKELKGCHSDVMLAKALSFDTFTDEDWFRFDGWRGINFLRKLTESQRKTLLARMPGKGPYCYLRILRNARDIGIATSSGASGSERKTTTLTNYILKMCRAHPEWGPVPVAVKAAMSRQPQLHAVPFSAAA